MDKKVFGLIAAVSGLGSLGAAQAATPPVNVDQAMTAGSFAELLDPVPNAVAVLQAADEAQAQTPAAPMLLAQDHHHHHQSVLRRLLAPHHHHHHHRYHHHHHHHHHHNSY